MAHLLAGWFARLAAALDRPAVDRSFADRVLHSALKVLFGYQTEVWEGFSATAAVLVGGMLVAFPYVDGSTLHTQLEKSFGFLDAYVPAVAVAGLVIAAAGVAGWVALKRTKFGAFRMWVAAALAFVWTTVAWGWLTSDLRHPLGAFFSVVAVWGWYTAWRLYSARKHVRQAGSVRAALQALAPPVTPCVAA